VRAEEGTAWAVGVGNPLVALLQDLQFLDGAAGELGIKVKVKVNVEVKGDGQGVCSTRAKSPLGFW